MGSVLPNLNAAKKHLSSLSTLTHTYTLMTMLWTHPSWKTSRYHNANMETYWPMENGYSISSCWLVVAKNAATKSLISAHTLYHTYTLVMTLWTHPNQAWFSVYTLAALEQPSQQCNSKPTYQGIPMQGFWLTKVTIQARAIPVNEKGWWCHARNT